MQTSSSDSLPILYVLTTVVAFLQTIIVLLMSWLVKTTASNKTELNTINTTLFGPNGKGRGLVDDVKQLETIADKVAKDISDIRHFLNVPSRRAEDKDYE